MSLSVTPHIPTDSADPGAVLATCDREALWSFILDLSRADLESIVDSLAICARSWTQAAGETNGLSKDKRAVYRQLAGVVLHEIATAGSDPMPL